MFKSRTNVKIYDTNLTHINFSLKELKLIANNKHCKLLGNKGDFY